VATFFINFKQRKWLVLRSFFKEIGEAFIRFFSHETLKHTKEQLSHLCRPPGENRNMSRSFWHQKIIFNFICFLN
jgi:hypothetical protein